MSFTPSKSIRPYGFQIYQTASGTDKRLPAPSEYNKNSMKSTSNISVPVPNNQGPAFGTKPSFYNFNLPIASGTNKRTPAPSEYDKNSLMSPSVISVPVPILPTREYIHSNFSKDPSKTELSSQLLNKDPMALALAMVKATKGTPNNQFWVKSLQLLTKLRFISIKRSLTNQEKTELTEIIKLMNEKAADLRPDELIAAAAPAGPGGPIASAGPPAGPIIDSDDDSESDSDSDEFESAEEGNDTDDEFENMEEKTRKLKEELDDLESSSEEEYESSSEEEKEEKDDEEKEEEEDDEDDRFTKVENKIIRDVIRGKVDNGEDMVITSDLIQQIKKGGSDGLLDRILFLLYRRTEEQFPEMDSVDNRDSTKRKYVLNSKGNLITEKTLIRNLTNPKKAYSLFLDEMTLYAD